MRLLHYSHTPVETLHTAEQIIKPDRKPQGFWVSVEGEDDWRSWCEAEDYCIGRHEHEVFLAESANVLCLRGVMDVDNFHLEYSEEHIPSYRSWGDELIRWDRVSRDYQGIIIAPYCWGRRLDGVASVWYYGWDCASGCIWDAGAVASITLIQDGQK